MMDRIGMPGIRRGRGLAAGAGLAASLGLAGCDLPKQTNPVQIIREISGTANADRLPPPGLDQPFPNLASVPPRPERPAAATREAISAALREDRADSRGPLLLRTVPGPEAPGAAPGQPALPSGPPPRPALAAAPRIPWTEAPPPRPGTVAAPEAALPGMPEEAPAPPPPDLLAIPPPPGPDLLAPPRPR